ncbi:ComF family protein [Mucilaginibacter straminoryzae]|uniref:ComF family protein n=1 Tax=Mucilaginibacter straminoryzae TaxID=2932774 RepID=UPI001FD70803|nr:phosphoribosyltransferase family protein [Mucilaginibacter straminoryzae]
MTRYEKVICTNCTYDLPYTDFHQHADHAVAKQFWGKVQLEGSYALLYFNKGSKVQRLMHRLKYKNMPKIGKVLGGLAGSRLNQVEGFKTVNVIIPVPLHPKRLKKRGYNQSTYFALGIAKRIRARVVEHNLIRTKATETQTHKTRLERFENMKAVFAVKRPQELEGKHILLVDDIMTTGSTLESCANVLLQIPGVKLSIATIAYAE